MTDPQRACSPGMKATSGLRNSESNTMNAQHSPTSRILAALVIALATLFSGQLLAAERGKAPKTPQTIIGLSLRDQSEAFYKWLAEEFVPKHMKTYHTNIRVVNHEPTEEPRPYELYALRDLGKGETTRDLYFALSSEKEGRKPASITFARSQCISGYGWVQGKATTITCRDFGRRFEVEGVSILRSLPWRSWDPKVESKRTLLVQLAAFLADKGFHWECNAVLTWVSRSYEKSRAEIEAFLRSYHGWPAEMEIEVVERHHTQWELTLPTLVSKFDGDVEDHPRRMADEYYEAWVKEEFTYLTLAIRTALDQSASFNFKDAAKLRKDKKHPHAGYSWYRLRNDLLGHIKASKETLTARAFFAQYERLKDMTPKELKKSKNRKLLERNPYSLRDQISGMPEEIKKSLKAFKSEITKARRLKGSEFDKAIQGVVLKWSSLVPVDYKGALKRMTREGHTRELIKDKPWERALCLNNSYAYLTMADAMIELAGKLPSGGRGSSRAYPRPEAASIAAEYYVIALRYMPGSPSIRTSLSKIYEVNKDFKKAKDQLQEIIKDKHTSQAHKDSAQKRIENLDRIQKNQAERSRNKAKTG